MTIYDLCWILATGDNGKHNQSESYAEKYQKRVFGISPHKTHFDFMVTNYCVLMISSVSFLSHT